MKNALVAATLAAALAGCATTTDTPEASSPAPAPSASMPQQAPAPQTGTARVDPVTGKPVPPVAQGMQGPDLKRSVYFEFDQYDVKPEYHGLIEANARWLKANPNAKLVIEGNTDERGSREYNLALGQRRAEAVARMMRLYGVDPKQIEPVSWGEERPRKAGHDESAWQENRRSDFVQR